MEAIRLLKRRPWGMAGAVILLAVILLATLSPLIAPYHFNEININHRLEAPGRDFVLGTDNLGRDVFSRFLYGSRPYIEVGLIAIGTATVLGLLLGFLSTGVRGKIDSVLRIAILIPWFLIVLFVLANFLFFFARVFAFQPLLSIMGPVVYPELVTVIIGLLLSFVFLPSVYAATRGAFFSALNFHALRQGLAPLLSLLLVNLGVAVGMAALVVAPLSYYGFGVPPPIPEWGNMLSSAGLRYFNEAPWMSTPPVIAIAVTLLGLILFGLALREIWVPRLPGPLTSPEQSRSAP